MPEPKATTKKRKTAMTSKKGVPVAPSTPGMFAGQFGGVSLNADRINLNVIYALWRSQGDLFACVREICTAIGSAGHEWKLANGDALEDSDVKGKAATALLNAGGVPWNKTRRKIQQALEVSGNAYVYVERGSDTKGSVVKITVIDPRTMRVVTDKYGTVIKWIQQVGANQVTFEPSEILHYAQDPDPNSSVFGMSAVETIVWDIRTDIGAVKSNYAFFENDATPATQYIIEEGISDEEYDKTIEKLKEQMQGAEKRHKALAIKGVKEIKTVGLSNKDMEFEVLRRLTTEKVCSVMGVPKAILNYTDDVNYSNGEAQMKKFYEGTIAPKEADFDEFVTSKLIPALGIEGLSYASKKRVFDNEEWTDASTRADVQLGIRTINEARKARGLKEFDATAEGEYVDKPLLYNGGAVIPLEDVGIDPTEGDPLDPNADPAAADGQDGKLMLVKPKRKPAPAPKPHAKPQR